MAVGCNDEVGNPATGGVIQSMFDDVAARMAFIKWPKFHALGFKGLMLFWYAGQGATPYIGGYYPGTGDPILVEPSSEAIHVATAGSSYLNQWEPYLTPYAPTIYRPRLYCGPPAASSGTSTAELRANTTVARALNAEFEWDTLAITDATTPNLPARLARDDLVENLSFTVGVESWDRHDIPEFEHWYTPGLGSVSAVGSNGVQPNARADLALEPAFNFYDPVRIRDVGGRPAVFILDFSVDGVFPTAAQKIARMSWWMQRGCDVYLSTSGFTDREAAEAARIADGWTRRWNRYLIESRHARTFMRS